MDYANLIVLALVVVICLFCKLIVAFIVARKDISTSKAKVICSLFDFNPLSILKK